MVLGVVSAAYANFSWALRYKHGIDHLFLDALDTVLGSVLLPVFRLVTVHAWAVVWSARDGETTSDETIGETEPETIVVPRKTNKTSRKTNPKTPRDAAETVLAFVQDAGPSHWRDVNKATGVSRAGFIGGYTTAQMTQVALVLADQPEPFLIGAPRSYSLGTGSPS